MKILLKAILFLCVPLLVFGQKGSIHFTEGLKKAFGKIEELRLSEAEVLISQEARKNPDNLAVPFIKGALLSIRLFANESEEDFDAGRVRMEEYILQLEKAPDSDPQKLLMIGQLRLAIAILHGKYRNEMSAGFQFYKAYNLLRTNYRKFPDYAPNYVPLGVLYVAIGSLPEGYQSIASIIGISGDVAEGMTLIKRGYWLSVSGEETKFYRNYFGFVYSYISLELNDDHTISPESLSLDYKKSSYLIYMQALVEVDKGNARKALNLLKKRPVGEGYYNFEYLDYYTGKIALAFSPDTADIYLKKYLEESTSDNYVKSAYRYLSWSAMLKGDKVKMEEYRSKVVNKGSHNTGADKQAHEEAQEELNEVLIRGRILFDGGRYEDGAEYLLSQEDRLGSFSMGEKIEFHYRLGRIYQEWKKEEKAIFHFKEALRFNDPEHSFSQGNSALQLASVLEDRGRKDEAIEYYRKTLSYKDFPFYEGLHQKAKVGLSRLKKGN